jgi:hypothetical protein
MSCKFTTVSNAEAAFLSAPPLFRHQMEAHGQLCSSSAEPQGKNSGIAPLIGRWVGSTSCLDAVTQQKKNRLCPKEIGTLVVRVFA